jgi:hypothetical protein
MLSTIKFNFHSNINVVVYPLYIEIINFTNQLQKYTFTIHSFIVVFFRFKKFGCLTSKIVIHTSI